LIDWRLKILDEVGSTSDVCIAAAEAGEPAGYAVMAHLQTAGRGSRGRNWQAPAGNLNLSVLLRPERDAAEAGLASLRAGVAVADALAQLGATGITLKWPNDLLLGDAKLGGILIDTVLRGHSLDWLVVGIGVNLAQAPALTDRKLTSLRDHGLNIEPASAAAAILERLAHWETVATSAMIDAWTARAHPAGTPLVVRTAAGALYGAFAGLTAAGELRLATADETMVISTGDVLLGLR